jgi:hypothetical protein
MLQHKKEKHAAPKHMLQSSMQNLSNMQTRPKIPGFYAV